MAILNYIGKFVELTIGLLSANATQTIILVATALITWWIYLRQNKQREREAATIILLELKSINETISKNLKSLNDDGTFDITKMWQTTRTCKRSSWESCRAILIKHFSNEEIKAINTYYKNSTIIDEQIDTFHNIIYATYKSFYIKYKEEDIDNETPHIRTFIDSHRILKEYSEKSLSLYEFLPISRLERLSRRD